MRKISKIALLASGDSAWIGGIQYTINIISALNEIAENQQLEVHILKRKGQNLGNLNNFINIKIQTLDLDVELHDFNLLNRMIWFLQRKLFNRINPQLENYLIKNKYDYVYPAVLSSCKGKINSGAWIADFQYYNFPEGHSLETTKEAERTISFIANKMNKVVFSSESVENEAFNLFPVINGKSHVMPFTVYINKDSIQNNNLSLVKSKYGIEGPFLIVSNLFATVKNHITLFEALDILKKKGVVITLVCTGNFVNYADMEFTNEILQIITKTGIRNQLFILGLIPREDQISLYRMSFAMVQPSLHEGWSTCVEEAKALGKTIIISDINVHCEQKPKNAIFFDPLDAFNLADKIEKVYIEQGHLNFPDLEKEKQAIKRYNLSIRNFGKLFLEIAAK